jgi:hypothetical protein
MAQHLSDEVPLLEDNNPEISDGTLKLVYSMISKKREKRIQTMESVSEKAAEILGIPLHTLPRLSTGGLRNSGSTESQRDSKKSRKGARWLLMGSILLLLPAAIFLFYGDFEWSRLMDGKHREAVQPSTSPTRSERTAKATTQDGNIGQTELESEGAHGPDLQPINPDQIPLGRGPNEILREEETTMSETIPSLPTEQARIEEKPVIAPKEEDKPVLPPTHVPKEEKKPSEIVAERSVALIPSIVTPVIPKRFQNADVLFPPFVKRIWNQKSSIVTPRVPEQIVAHYASFEAKLLIRSPWPKSVELGAKRLAQNFQEYDEAILEIVPLEVTGELEIEVHQVFKDWDMSVDWKKPKKDSKDNWKEAGASGRNFDYEIKPLPLHQKPGQTTAVLRNSQPIRFDILNECRELATRIRRNQSMEHFGWVIVAAGKKDGQAYFPEDQIRLVLKRKSQKSKGLRG